jgi:hypothetical protein
MRALLTRIPSTILALYVGVIDAGIWCGVIPFELYCRRFIAQPQHSFAATFALLFANVLLLVLILTAGVAMTELARRGFTRRVPVVLRTLSAARSKRSAR